MSSATAENTGTTGTTGTSARPGPSGRRGPLLVMATVLGIVVCAAVAAVATLADVGVYERSGIAAPPLDVRVLGPLTRTVALLATALTAGSLLYAAFLAPARSSGTVGADGYRAMRRTAVSAAVAGVAAVLAAWTATADLTGSPLSRPGVNGPFAWFSAAATLEEPMGWLLAGVLLLVVAAGCAWFLSWRAAAVLGVLTLAATTFPAAVATAATGAGHNWSGDGNLLRALGGIVWLGAVAALAAQRLHGGEVTATTGHRLRVLLLGAGSVFLVGEALFQTIVVGPGSLTGTAYGRLLLAELPLLLLVAVGTAVLVRRGPHQSGPLLPVGLVTGGALLAALIVAQGHSVPPRFLARPDSSLETLIGWDIERPFTMLAVLSDARFNVLFGTAALLAAACYLYGVRRLAARGIAWARGRTVAWLSGCAVVLIATSSGLGTYAPAMFSVHMISHMTLNMLAPILLCMGGPVTLALRVLPTAGRAQPPGPREWLLAAVHSRMAKVLTNPGVAAVLFVGSFYVLYFTPLFGDALRYHWAHQLMYLHFLAVGYLFFWPLIGVDSAPNRLPHLGRLAVLLATMPFHAFFGIAVMNSNSVIGESFYRDVGLPWIGDLLRDQQVGGGIAWATGEIPMLLVVIALIVQWSREDARVAVRSDRQADRDGDADLKAYNEMLARLRSGR